MVEPAGTHTFRPHQRLHRRKQFLVAYDQGSRQHGRFMTLFATPNGLPTGRLGVSATRRFGGAVARNAAKRRLREVFRRHVFPPVAGLDLVLIPKPDLLNAAFAAVADEFSRLLTKPLKGRVRGPKATS